LRRRATETWWLTRPMVCRPRTAAGGGRPQGRPCRGRAGARCHRFWWPVSPARTSEPDVRVPTHPALHEPMPAGYDGPIGAAWSGSPVPAPRPAPPWATARRYSPASSWHASSPAADSLPPFAMPRHCGACGRLSRPRTTTAAPSRPATNSRRRACPPPAWTAGGEGGPRTVPTFTINRSTGSVPSYSPAASPRVRRRPSPWPPGRPPQPASESPSHAAGRACAAARPRSARFRAGFSLAGVPPLVPAIRAPSRLACRARAVWQCRPVPSLSGLLPPSPAPPGLGCPQLHRAATTAQRWAFHPTRSNGASWRTKW
jgi:hypothetical protein